MFSLCISLIYDIQEYDFSTSRFSRLTVCSDRLKIKSSADAKSDGFSNRANILEWGKRSCIRYYICHC